MEMIDSVITSSSLKSPGNTASMNCRKMKIQPRKSTHKVIPASEVSDLATPCTLVNCNQASTVHCSNEDSQLNIGKAAKFVYCEHSTMCIKDTSCLALEDIIPTGWEPDTDCPASEDIIASGWESDTGFPASEDIIATGWESSSHSDMPEPGCTEINSLSSDLAGAGEIQSVPCDSRFVGSDLCPSNSDMVYTGILRPNSGCTRFNSQVKSSSSGWSRNRMISNGFRKFQKHSREFGKARSARRDQSYTGSLSSVNSSLSQIKCVKKEARHNDISASNQTYRAKPMGSDFVRQRVGTRNKKQGTHSRKESYVENHSVAEIRSTGSSPSNQFTFDQQLLSSELPYAVDNVPHQNAHRSAYRMRERIYRSCGQEAAVPPMCSFDQGFGISGVQFLSVPVQSSATGYLALEGWADGTYQPYSFDASQHLSTPGLYTGTTIDFSVPQQGDSQCYYGHESVSSGLYQCGFMSEFDSPNLHGIPQPAQLISYVPFDYHGTMVHPEQVMSDADLVSPEETKDADSNNRIGAKVNEKTKTFDGCECDATSRTPETETREKIDSIGSDVTDSVRTYKADTHSDGNKNQVDLLSQCSAPGDRFTYVCSQKTAKALAASWKSQVDSESILEATGSPIAQFEKLLNATAPIIASSSYNPPDVSLCSTPRSILLSKSWWPDVSLLDVWEWYIECASFGIGVKVEDSWNSDSFSAYFIPSLSAVQLLGYSQSSLSNSLKKLNVDVHKTENTGNCLGSPSSGSDIPSSLLQNDSSEVLIASSSAPSFRFSDDAELIFEYFEHDQPQNRKPLPQTIVEIKEQGSSNPRSLGDPSKLDQLKLHDLHPASWYSVAWYPIYRIPENNRTNIPPLRASFLTYHSLSHLVMRHESPDQLGNSSLCVVPALGMRRYNGKEECWYCPTEFPGPVHIHGLPSDNSKVVEQRLRALEEVAAIFSDGHIQKNGVRAGNKHPDYDFFIRRT